MRDRHTMRGFHRSNQEQDTPQRIADRKRRIAILVQVCRERIERFPVLDDLNLADALAWQENRAKELGL